MKQSNYTVLSAIMTIKQSNGTEKQEQEKASRVVLL